MLKYFSFTKNDYTFYLRNPILDEYGKLRLEWKVENECENKNTEEGFFFGGTLDENRQSLICYKLKLKGKEYAGIELPEEIFEVLTEIYNDLREERERSMNKIINEIIEGTRPIDFSIVGCDYPHYQAWLYNLPENLRGLEQNIMARTITKYTGEKHILSSCDYLEKKLNTRIITKDKLRKDAFNLKFDEEKQKYYGFNSDVVTGFQVKLSDLISDEYLEELKIEKEKRQKAIEETENRKKSLIIEIIKRGKEKGSDGTDFYAIVKLTEPITKETLKFECRNIFDVGYIINPCYEVAPGIKGGISRQGYWQDFKAGQGWYNVRKLTNFEEKCLNYLKEFSPINKSIRL